MKEKKHYQVLKDIVKKLNKSGRDLSVHDDHDKQEFIILRIKEGNKAIKFPGTNIRLYELDEGKTVYETPVRSALAETPYGYTDDKDIEKELLDYYDNDFKVYHAVGDSLREISRLQEKLYNQQ